MDQEYREEGVDGSWISFIWDFRISTIFKIIVIMGALCCCYSYLQSHRGAPSRRPAAMLKYTVTISKTYINNVGNQVADTQSMEFGSEEAANLYAGRYLGKENVHVEIKGPPIETYL